MDVIANSDLLIQITNLLKILSSNRRRQAKDEMNEGNEDGEYSILTRECSNNQRTLLVSQQPFIHQDTWIEISSRFSLGT